MSKFNAWKVGYDAARKLMADHREMVGDNFQSGVQAFEQTYRDKRQALMDKGVSCITREMILTHTPDAKSAMHSEITSAALRKLREAHDELKAEYGLGTQSVQKLFRGLIDEIN